MVFPNTMTERDSDSVIQYQHFDLWYCACDNKASVYIKLSNNCELNRAMKLTTGQVQLVPIKLIRG